MPTQAYRPRRPAATVLHRTVREHLERGVSGRGRTMRLKNLPPKLFYQQGNIVICTFISPFRADRYFVRSILPVGAFHEVYVKCDLAVCKRRDPKGLYAKAEAGLIRDFTGIDSPYEEPVDPEIVVETDLESVETVMGRILGYLGERGVI